MGKKGNAHTEKTTENHNESVDTQTRDYMSEIQNAARNAGLAGPSPLVTGAADYNTGLQKAGGLGLDALSGNTAATQQLMNPYQQQVIDANNAQWQHVNQQTQNQINDRATRAGAFGGSRQGVATGTALAANNQSQQGQTAGLLQGGFSDAMNRASQLASGGYAGAQSNANLGLGGVGNAQQWLLQMLNQGYRGPTGGTSGGSKWTGGVSTEGSFHIPGFG